MSIPQTQINWVLACIGSIVVLGSLMFSGKAIAEQTLGHFPLCEASSALILPCPKSKGECLIVGDNEQRKHLFVFPVQYGTVSSERQKELNLQLPDDGELSDIEALTRVSIDQILIFGSHSRNSKCQAKKKRRRFATVQISSEGAKVVQMVQSKKIQCDRLFGEISSKDSVLQSVCKAINNAEKKAKKLEGKLQGRDLSKKQEEKAKARCNEILPFNAEGAVTVPGSEGTDVWIGLRAPLLPEHPDQAENKNLAMLLHMKDHTAYEFDKVTLLDLDGRGIRELSYAEGSVWVIAGPAEDKKEPFQLRRFAKHALGSAEVIKPELIDSLPTSSEGLAILEKKAYVVIDGDTGKDKSAKQCKEPSKYKVISLPQKNRPSY